MRTLPTRRAFVAAASAVGAAAFLSTGAAFADEPPPETTTVRLSKSTNMCFAPWYIAEELLRAEGFTDIRYAPVTGGFAYPQQAARGEIDFGASFAGSVAFHIDAGLPITAVAGLHIGCYELFVHEPIRTIADLRGKSIAIQDLTSSAHLYLSIMAAYVGLDPKHDITWVTSPEGRPIELFAEGKVDAFLGFPPEPYELRARKIGRVILRTTTDHPWSQYFCCTAFGNREFVRAHPVATKRYLRAILKATDLCAAEPERVAQQLVDVGFTQRYDYALQTLTEIPYDRWREFDPEDSLRFYALRLQEVGMIKSSPSKLIAEGTDWRFFNELKRELKA
jgi:NitT/TauT family transport system substrate-binding protein